MSAGRDEVFRQYIENNPESEKLFRQSEDLFPKGVCHDVRNYAPFPLCIESAKGAYIKDVDGHEYIDLWMGHFANLLGHNNPVIVNKIKEAADVAVHPGCFNPYQMQLAGRIREAVPEMESMRFCTSGTEATMYVCRVARTYTDRPVIVKIEGGWHGGNTDLSTGVKPPFSEPSTTGLCINEQTVSIPFNNIEDSKAILENLGRNVAGIILEPVLGSGGGIPADKEYLLMLRKFCDDNGSVLIFDEVITAFRFRLGSVWKLLGVKPDMFTMGKIVGGGMHIGVYGGSKDVMDTIKKRKIIVGGGTYSANPISMMAGAAALDELAKQNYEALNAEGEKLQNGLKKLIENKNAAVTGYKSFFSMHFFNGNDEFALEKPSGYAHKVCADYDNIFKLLMINEGVYTMHSGGCLTFAHIKDGLFDIILEKYKKALGRL